MKRFVCIVLALAMLLALSPAAFAASSIVRAEIRVAEPVEGERPQDPDVTVVARSAGAAQTLSEKDGDYTLSATWREAGGKDVFTGAFINGRRYELVIRLTGLLAAYQLEADLEMSLNGRSVTARSVVSVKGEDVVFTLPFTTVPGDITPAVSLEADGKPEKEYDGQTVTLRAVVKEPLDGVTYTYQWYKDKAVMPEATADALSLRNVDSSGAYTCKVRASSGKESRESESLAIPVKITPHSVTIVLENAEKNDGDPDPDLTYTVLGDVYDLLTGSPAREEGEAEGEYEIQVGTLAFDDAVKGNYAVTVQPGRFTIVGTGVVTFTPLTEVADLSYLAGRAGSHVRVSATKSALPKGAILSLTTVDAEGLAALQEAAGEKGLMKSLSLSLVQEDGTPAALRKNAILRVYLPLTEKEERYAPETLTALFRGADGKVTPLALGREAAGASGVVYVSVELTAPGDVALVKGKLLPKADEETDAATKEPPKKGAPWLWFLLITFSLAALGVIAWVLIRARKTAAPTKTYVPKKKPVPEERPQETAPEKPVRKPISFEDLEDEADDRKK